MRPESGARARELHAPTQFGPTPAPESRVPNPDPQTPTLLFLIAQTIKS